jgi:ABC-type branched-subunit amino acid transport system substrate-binding protein
MGRDDNFRPNRRDALKASGVVATSLVAGCTNPLAGGGDGGGGPITVGHLADETGALSVYGQNLRRHGELMVEYINNEMDGIDGREVEYIVEDSQSDPQTAVERYRRLVDRGADIILGSDMGSAVVATNPLAKELNTVTFQMGDPNSVVEEGNRWNFYELSVAKEWAKGHARFGVEVEEKETWSTMVWDYSWGHSFRDMFTQNVEEMGGEVLSQVEVPAGDTDMTTYVPELDEESEGVYFAMSGSSLFNAFNQLQDRFSDDITAIQVAQMIGINPQDLGEFVNGVYVDEAFLPYLIEDVPSDLRDMRREYRDMINVDDMGRDAESGDYVHYTNSIMVWDPLMYLKSFVEENGWPSKEEASPDFIRYLEGREIEGNTFEHPAGPQRTRAEDHVIRKPHFIFQVQDYQRKVASKLAIEDFIAPPLNDFTSEEL